MDTSLFFFINKDMQNAVLDAALPFITDRAKFLYVLLAVIPIFKKPRKGLLVFILCLIGIAASDSSGNILKHAFERPRPCQVLESVRLLSGCGRSFSMPSNHAVNAFAFAVIFGFFFRIAAIPSLSLAVLVGLSRIYIGVHYPSDVIAGALWGSTVGFIVILLYLRLSQRWGSIALRTE